jgi:hypothetical protein
MIQQYNCQNEIPRFEQVLPTLAETTETLNQFLPSVATTTYPIFLQLPYAGTIASLTIEGATGTGTATVKVNGSSLTGLTNIAVSTIEQTYYATGATFVALQDIVIQFTAASSLTNCSINLVVVRAIPATVNTWVTLPSGVQVDGTKQEAIYFQLTSGTVLQTYLFTIQKTDSFGVPSASYIVQGSVYNGVDNVFISTMVVAQSSLGITLLCSAPPATNNYYFRGQALVI